MTAIFSRRAQRARLRRRRRAALLMLLAVGVAVTAAVLGAAPGSPSEPAEIRLKASGVVVARVALAPFQTKARIDAARLRRAVIALLPTNATAARGFARITYLYDRSNTAERAVLLAQMVHQGGTLTVVRTAISSQIAAPVMAQRMRNDCEATALSILLRTAGVTVSQARLQAMFPRSGPLDPTGGAASKVWGDPDLGFVGRPNGAGVAGGFGIYPAPVAVLARRFGVKLENLTSAGPGLVYDRLLAGHAVMAWIGLANGPYSSWQTPQGKMITVNLNEHTVVLHGIDANGQVSVANPLKGTEETWSRQQFETKWKLLGRRALST